MAVHQSTAALAEKARIVSAPSLRANRGERVFDLHPAVHLMTIAVLTLPALILGMGIFFAALKAML